MGLHPEFEATLRAARVRRGFFIHLAVFAVVNTLLVGINLATTPDRLWFQWPLVGWGLGILAHAGAAFMPALLPATQHAKRG